MGKSGGGSRGRDSGSGGGGPTKDLTLTSSPSDVISGFNQWENFIESQGIDLAVVPRPTYEGRGIERRLAPFTTEQEIASSIQIARDVVRVAQGRLSDQLVVVRQGSRIQGMGVLTPDAGARSVYVNRIATAPWNHSSSTREAAGVGRSMIQEAVRRSISLGYGGRLTTNPVGNSEGFYRRLGFERLSRGTSELTLSPEKARSLL